MNIFITGATGFIGSHLLRLLIAKGFSVTALRRSINSYPRVKLQYEPVWLEKPMEELQPEDLALFDVVIHLASVGISPRQATWEELFHWNVLMQLRLMAIAKSAGVRRFVCSGSYAEYGKSADFYEFIPHDAPLLPTSAYAASKAAGFTAAWAFAIENKLELCYLRIFSAYGEGQYSGNFWPSLRSAALSGADFLMSPGEQIRDFVAVELVTDALLDACISLTVLPSAPLVKNVASGEPVSLRTFAEHWWENWGATGKLQVGALPYRTNEPMRYVPKL